MMRPIKPTVTNASATASQSGSKNLSPFQTKTNASSSSTLPFWNKFQKEVSQTSPLSPASKAVKGEQYGHVAVATTHSSLSKNDLRGHRQELHRTVHSIRENENPRSTTQHGLDSTRDAPDSVSSGGNTSEESHGRPTNEADRNASELSTNAETQSTFAEKARVRKMDDLQNSNQKSSDVSHRSDETKSTLSSVDLSEGGSVEYHVDYFHIPQALLNFFSERIPENQVQAMVSASSGDPTEALKFMSGLDPSAGSIVSSEDVGAMNQWQMIVAALQSIVDGKNNGSEVNINGVLNGISNGQANDQIAIRQIELLLSTAQSSQPTFESAQSMLATIGNTLSALSQQEQSAKATSLAAALSTIESSIASSTAVPTTEVSKAVADLLVKNGDSEGWIKSISMTHGGVVQQKSIDTAGTATNDSIDNIASLFAHNDPRLKATVEISATIDELRLENSEVQPDGKENEDFGGILSLLKKDSVALPANTVKSEEVTESGPDISADEPMNLTAQLNRTVSSDDKKSLTNDQHESDSTSTAQPSSEKSSTLHHGQKSFDQSGEQNGETNDPSTLVRHNSDSETAEVKSMSFDTVAQPIQPHGLSLPAKASPLSAVNQSSEAVPTFFTRIDDVPPTLSTIIKGIGTGETGVARLQLSPENLGTVSVQIQMLEGRAHVVMTVESEATKKLLEQSLHALKESGLSNNVKFESVEIRVKDSESASTRDSTGNQTSGQQRSDDQKSRDQYLKNLRQENNLASDREELAFSAELHSRAQDLRRRKSVTMKSLIEKYS